MRLIPKHIQLSKLSIGLSIFAFICLLLACFALGKLRYTNMQLADSQKKISELQKQNQNFETEESLRNLISEIGKLIDLPKDEKPTVATVADLTKLQGQAFFAHAAVGDKVLIYTESKKAILYRPTEHKIIEVGPISTGSDTNSPKTK